MKTIEVWCLNCGRIIGYKNLKNEYVKEGKIIGRTSGVCSICLKIKETERELKKNGHLGIA